MTEFYIFLPDDDKSTLQYDTNILGRESFGTFYAERGMQTLERIIERKPSYLKDTEIVTDAGTKYSITEFLDHLNKLKVLFN
tara:strand:- start:4454 stop:4699 length:246 start_codon:yes stop_codon:yes gene_type:complete